MNNLLLNNGSFYETHGRLLCSYCLIPLFFGVFFFPFTSVSSGHVAPVDHFAQCGLAHSLQLVGGRKNTFQSEQLAQSVVTIDRSRGGPVTQAWPMLSLGILS